MSNKQSVPTLVLDPATKGLTDLIGYLPFLEQMYRWLDHWNWQTLDYIIYLFSVAATEEGPLEDDITTFGTRVDDQETTTAPLVEGLA